MGTHCCESMSRNVVTACRIHSNSSDCPDVVIHYSEVYDEYGVPVHDGVTSTVRIAFCPWCGAKLPESRRDEWFETLARLGFDDPAVQEIPPEFRSDAWYRRSG